MIEHDRLTSLVERAQKDDEAALNELVSECYNIFYYLAFKITGDKEKAQEATQNSFLEILGSLKKLKEPAAFIKWANQIIYHQCIRYQTKNPTVLSIDDEDEDGLSILDRVEDEDINSLPEQFYEEKEFQQTIQDIVDSLPPDQRSAMMLYYYERMSVKEIAQIQGVTEGTVKSRLSYGRKAVRKKVEEYEDRTGIKLHGALPITALLFKLFSQGAMELSLPATPVVTGGTIVFEAAAGAGTAAAGAGATAAGVGAAAGTTAAATAGMAAGGVAVKAVGSAVIAKVIVGIVAAIVAVGTTVGGIMLIGGKNSDRPDKDVPTVSVPHTETVPDNNDNNDHVHTFVAVGEEGNDNNYHNVKCDCGKTEQALHDFRLKEEGEELHDLSDLTCATCGFKNYFILDGIANSNNELVSITIAGTFVKYPVVVIPSEILGFAVTAIEAEAFEEDTTLVEIVIPDSVTSIGDTAFAYCSSLSKVTLPNSIVEFGDAAFGLCTSLKEIKLPNSINAISTGMFARCTSLEKITIPDSVTEIGDNAFFACSSLKEVIIPESVTVIYEDAFAECVSLEKITIPASVTVIEDAFELCEKLSTVVYEGTVAQWNAPGVDERNMFKHSPAAVVRCSDGEVSFAFAYTVNKDNETCTITEILRPDTVVVIPSVIDGYRVTSIASISDSENSSTIESIIIQEGIVEIENGAFGGLESLRTVQLPASLQIIGDAAFYGCISLQSIQIPEGVYTIGERAFCDCKSLTEITIPSLITVISYETFGACVNLKKVNLPEGLLEIDHYAFIECYALESIEIPNSVTKIGNCAFRGCESIAELTLPTSLTTIGSGAFESCYSLTELIIPDTVNEIGESAFAGCTGLIELVIPQGVKRIEHYTFSHCSALKKLVLSANIEYIGVQFLNECASLKEVEYGGTADDFDAIEKVESMYTTYNWYYGMPSGVILRCADGIYGE